MKKIEAIGIFDNRLTESNNTIINYCQLQNIPLEYKAYNYDININQYFKILFSYICEKLKKSDTEYLIVFGPYLKINNFDIDINTDNSYNFDLLFFNPIIKQESWSFFLIKKSNKLISSIEKILKKELPVTNFSPCAHSHSENISNILLYISSILSSDNIRVIDKYIDTIFSVYLKKEGLFDSFCTSFFKDSLNFESKFSNLNKKEYSLSFPKLSHHSGTNDICIISIFTDGNKNYAQYSLKSISDFCQKNMISYVFFDGPFIENAAPNFSKANAIHKAMQVYDTVIWIDSDCLITNNDFELRSFCRSINKDFIAFSDPSRYNNFNSGVMIFKKSKFCLSLLGRVYSNVMSLQNLNNIYAEGGDQLMFNKAAIEMDPDGDNHAVLPARLMNCHPIIWKDGDFILHAMGYGSEYRENYLAHMYFKKKNQDK